MRYLPCPTSRDERRFFRRRRSLGDRLSKSRARPLDILRAPANLRRSFQNRLIRVRLLPARITEDRVRVINLTAMQADSSHPAAGNQLVPLALPQKRLGDSINNRRQPQNEDQRVQRKKNQYENEPGCDGPEEESIDLHRRN